MVDDPTAMLTELMLQAEVLCGRLESGANDLPDIPDRDELRLKLSQCGGFLTQLQKRYDEDKLEVSDPLTVATFRQLVMCLMWATFRAGRLVDYKLFRKLVQIESAFTYLLINGQRKKT